MHPDGPKLMHNLGEILILFLIIYQASVKSFPYNRIVIDSFSNGFAFWSLHDILKFIDLCRSLPNSENQCLLWTINQHPSIETMIYHLAHVMDIGLETSVNDTVFLVQKLNFLNGNLIPIKLKNKLK